MKRFKLFGAPSIRRRISTAFLIVIALVVTTALVSYIQLSQVKPTTELIVHYSEDLGNLLKVSIATVALDADLEQYIVIGGPENRENVQSDLQDLANGMTALQGASADHPEAGFQLDLAKLSELITQVDGGTQRILDAQAGASAAETNRNIVLVYNEIEALSQLQKDLTAKVVDTILSTSEVQIRIADNVLLQSVILGTIVVVVAVATSFVTDRRLRAIVNLTNTATAISEGDLSRNAPVESDDEIGALARSFNAMTGQLRDLISTLEQRIAQRTRAIETSAEVSRRLSTILDPQQLVFAVVEEIKEAFNYYHVHIYFYDEQKENLVMAGGTGEAGRTLLERGHAVPRGRGLVGQAAENNQDVLVPDTRSDPNWLPNLLLPETQSELAVPITIGNNVLGVLDVQQNVKEGLTQQDVELLRSIANQIAVAIQNARTFTVAQKQAEREAIINTISQRIQSANTPEAVLQIAASELASALGTQRAVVQIDRTMLGQQGKSPNGGKV